MQSPVAEDVECCVERPPQGGQGYFDHLLCGEFGFLEDGGKGEEDFWRGGAPFEERVCD